MAKVKSSKYGIEVEVPESVVINHSLTATGAAIPTAPPVAGKLYGLVKDPVTRYGYTFYFLVTASVGESGEIIAVDKSEQSWFMWEALHKLERQVELSCIDIQKNTEQAK